MIMIFLRAPLATVTAQFCGRTTARRQHQRWIITKEFFDKRGIPNKKSSPVLLNRKVLKEKYLNQWSFLDPICSVNISFQHSLTSTNPKQKTCRVVSVRPEYWPVPVNLLRWDVLAMNTPHPPLRRLYISIHLNLFHNPSSQVHKIKFHLI